MKDKRQAVVKLITGGVRSGKSAFAERIAKDGKNVLYIATGVETDGEMRERIRAHRERRPADWRTLESPYDLLSTAWQCEGYDTILLDELGVWVSNRILQTPEKQIPDPLKSEHIFNELKQWIREVGRWPDVRQIIIVSSETGLGGIAMSPLGRWFQDLLGQINQWIAEQAEEAHFVISGIPWRIKG